MSTTVTMSDAAATDVRNAVASELLDQARAVVSDLEDHYNNGAPTALADAQWKGAMIGRLAAVLADLEPAQDRAAS